VIEIDIDESRNERRLMSQSEKMTVEGMLTAKKCGSIPEGLPELSKEMIYLSVAVSLKDDHQGEKSTTKWTFDTMNEIVSAEERKRTRSWSGPGQGTEIIIQEETISKNEMKKSSLNGEEDPPHLDGVWPRKRL
jgi:hypothetical protein